MVKFRSLFTFSKKEIHSYFKKAKFKNKINGLKLLQTNPEKPDQEFGKLLIIIPKRSGKATKRNLIKRQIKAIFYEEKLFKNPLISILFVYKTAMELTFDQLKVFLVKSLK